MTRRTSSWKRAAGTRWLGVAILLLAIPSAACAQPVYLVNTGEGPSTGGLSLRLSQFLAGQFTLDFGSEINALEGRLIDPGFDKYPVYAVVYGDARRGLEYHRETGHPRPVPEPGLGVLALCGIPTLVQVARGGGDSWAAEPHATRSARPGAWWLARVGPDPVTSGRKSDHAG